MDALEKTIKQFEDLKTVLRKDLEGMHLNIAEWRNDINSRYIEIKEGQQALLDSANRFEIKGLKAHIDYIEEQNEALRAALEKAHALLEDTQKEVNE